MYKQLGSTKQSRPHTFSSILPICINTQLLRVQNVHTNYRKFVCGFLNSRLLNFARNSRKLMCHEYFYFYSSAFLKNTITTRFLSQTSCLHLAMTAPVNHDHHLFHLFCHHHQKHIHLCNLSLSSASHSSPFIL